MRHHVIAVKVRTHSDYTVQEAGQRVFDALNNAGLEVIVDSGDRMLSNYGEHLARYLAEDGGGH